MNTVKIKLKTSGSLAELSADFRIFQNSYRNKLIDIYVPKTILYESGQIGTFESAVKIGAILKQPDGSSVTTEGYYADYLDKIETINGVEYAVYELTMPNTFTTAVGEQKLVINVVNMQNFYEEATVTAETQGTYYIQTTNEDDETIYTPVLLPDEYDSETTYYTQIQKILEVVTTQTCQITVLESAYLSEDELLDPTQLDNVYGKLGVLEVDVHNLQDDVDNLDDRITQNTSDIADNAQDIADIKNTFISGENYIGTKNITETSGYTPFNNDGTVKDEVKTILTDFVYNVVTRQPKANDTVILVVHIEDETDKNYKMLYSTTWTGYEIPPMELASNGDAGLITGTYGVGSSNNTIVNIVGGEIKNVYVKDTENSTYVDVGNWLNSLQNETDTTDSALTNLSTGLSSGTFIVKKAEQDASGNNIVDTYMTQNAGATKTYVKDYALPKVFNDVYYITADGYTTTVPTTVSPQFTLTTTAIGESQIFQLVKNTTAQYELSSNNSYTNKIYLTSDKDCDIILRLTTEAYTDGAWHTLRTELSNTINLIEDEIQQISMGSAFSDLGNTVLNIVENNQIRQTLSIITETSQHITFEIYSNNVYPSTFTLDTQSLTQIVSQGELGEQRVYNAIGTLDNGVITFELEENAVINLKTEAEFKLSYAGTPTDSDEMVLALGEETYRLVLDTNMLSGNPTVEDMKCVPSYTQSGTQYWIFKGFIELQGSDTIIRVDGDVYGLYSHYITMVKTSTLYPSYRFSLQFTIYSTNPNQMTFTDVYNFLNSSGYTGSHYIENVEIESDGYKCFAMFNGEPYSESYLYAHDNNIYAKSAVLGDSITVNNYVRYVGRFPSLEKRTIGSLNSSNTEISDNIIKL